MTSFIFRLRKELGEFIETASPLRIISIFSVMGIFVPAGISVLLRIFMSSDSPLYIILDSILMFASVTSGIIFGCAMICGMLKK